MESKNISINRAIKFHINDITTLKASGLEHFYLSFHFFHLINSGFANLEQTQDLSPDKQKINKIENKKDLSPIYIRFSHLKVDDVCFSVFCFPQTRMTIDRDGSRLGTTSPVHVHVEDDTPVHVYVKKPKKPVLSESALRVEVGISGNVCK